MNLIRGQGCINFIRSPAMAMDQIEFFCPFPDWLKNNLNFTSVTNPKIYFLKSKDLNALFIQQKLGENPKKNMILIATRSFTNYGIYVMIRSS